MAMQTNGEFRRARRRPARLRLGIVGPAGSGKTASALLIAYGISGDWERIGMVDTENGSGELYAGSSIGGTDIGQYQVLPLSPPFLPEKYIKAIAKAEQAGLEVLILDSITHAWAGEGGLLDLHGKISAKGGNSYAAWREVTPLHQQLVEAMLQSSLHIIATMRSKMEYTVDRDKEGGTRVRKVGLAPIQREGMDYEFNTVFDLSPEHVASATKDRTGIFDGCYFVPGVETGRVLQEWLQGGHPHPEADPSGHSEDKDGGSPPNPLTGSKEAAGKTVGRSGGHLGPILEVMKAKGLGVDTVRTVALEVTGKHSPGDLTTAEVEQVALVLAARE